MDPLSNQLAFTERKFRLPVKFWATLSNNIFHKQNETDKKGSIRPSISLFAGLNNFKSLPISRKRNFRSKMKENNEKFNIQISQKYKPIRIANKRRKSVDVLTTRPECQLLQFVKRLNKKNIPETRYKKPQNKSIKTLGHSMELENRKIRGGSTVLKKNPSSKKPSLINIPAEDKIFTHKTIQRTESILKDISSLDNKIIDLLKRTLSILITESVYLKDFYKLFGNYLTKPYGIYNFRSKSANKNKHYLSTRKQHSSEHCLFTDYLLNVYLHYNLKKEAKTKQYYIMDKNIIFMTELDRQELIKNDNETTSKIAEERKYFFNFLYLNKYLKEFIYSIKNLNKNDKLLYIEVSDEIKTKDKSLRKSGSFEDIKFTNHNSMNLSIVDKPVTNIKSASLFQKIVQHTVDNDVHQKKTLEIKNKVNNCLRKSLLFLKQDINHKKGKSQPIINRNRNFKSLSKQRETLNKNTMYNLPRVSNYTKINASIVKNIKNVSKNFKLKNFDGPYSTRINPYTQRLKLKNFNIT